MHADCWRSLVIFDFWSRAKLGVLRSDRYQLMISAIRQQMPMSQTKQSSQQAKRERGELALLMICLTISAIIRRLYNQKV